LFLLRYARHTEEERERETEREALLMLRLILLAIGFEWVSGVGLIDRREIDGHRLLEARYSTTRSMDRFEHHCDTDLVAR